MQAHVLELTTQEEEEKFSRYIANKRRGARICIRGANDCSMSNYSQNKFQDTLQCRDNQFGCENNLSS